MNALQRVIAYVVSLAAALLTVVVLGSLGGGYMSGPLARLTAVLYAPVFAVVTAAWHPVTARCRRWTSSSSHGDSALRCLVAVALVSLVAAMLVALALEVELGVLFLAGFLVSGVTYLQLAKGMAAGEGETAAGKGMGSAP